MSPLTDLLAGTDIALRDETAGDAPFLERAFASFHAANMAAMGLPPEMIAMLMRQQYAIHSGQQRAQFPDAAHWIIELRGAPVGCVCVNHGPDEHRLVEIVLLPEARGQGVGAAIIRAIQDEARAARCNVTLHVERSNPARQLYLRLGFESAWEDEASEFMRWTAARER